MGFEDYPKNFLWAGLFLVAIVSFALLLGAEYGFTSEELIDERIDIVSLEGQINSTTYSQSLASANSTLEDELSTSANVLSISSLWGTVKNMFSIITGFFNIFTNLVINVLGIPAIVFYTIVSIFIIGVIFSMWRLIVTGK